MSGSASQGSARLNNLYRGPGLCQLLLQKSGQNRLPAFLQCDCESETGFAVCAEGDRKRLCFEVDTEKSLMSVQPPLQSIGSFNINSLVD